MDSPQVYPAFMGDEQNYSLTDKVEIVFHQNRNGLLGFLRPKKLEEEVQIFDEAAREDMNVILFREDKGFFKAYVGHEFKHAFYEIKDDYDFKDWVYANGGDVYNYLTFFAGHTPTADDYASLGANPNGPGTQTHKQVIYKLTARPDVIAHQGSNNVPNIPTHEIQPGESVIIKASQ